MISFKWIGGEEMAKKLQDLAKKFPPRMKAALYAECQIMMTESKRRCPVSPTVAQLKAMGRSRGKGVVPGTLRASGRVSEPVQEGDNIICTLSYGGGGIDYAVVQHERLDYHHTNGQAKYLESVMNEARPELAARLARRLDISGNWS